MSNPPAGRSVQVVFNLQVVGGTVGATVIFCSSVLISFRLPVPAQGFCWSVAHLPMLHPIGGRGVDVAAAATIFVVNNNAHAGKICCNGFKEVKVIILFLHNCLFINHYKPGNIRNASYPPHLVA